MASPDAGPVAVHTPAADVGASRNAAGGRRRASPVGAVLRLLSRWGKIGSHGAADRQRRGGAVERGLGRRPHATP